MNRLHKDFHILTRLHSHTRSHKTRIPCSKLHTLLWPLSRFIKWGNIKVMFPKATLFEVYVPLHFSFKFFDGGMQILSGGLRHISHRILPGHHTSNKHPASRLSDWQLSQFSLSLRHISSLSRATRHSLYRTESESTSVMFVHHLCTIENITILHWKSASHRMK